MSALIDELFYRTGFLLAATSAALGVAGALFPVFARRIRAPNHKTSAAMATAASCGA